MDSELKQGLTITSIALLVLGALIVLGMWGCPTYKVWRETQAGKAELAKAQYNRQIAVAEALAKMESAKYLAEGEVIRARGVDSAVKIIGGALNANESYLRYLYIQDLKDSKNQIIYLPTEAGLPILEANRFPKTVPLTPEK